MLIDTDKFFQYLKSAKAEKVLLLSLFFCWLFMFLDIFTTLYVSGGDMSMEGNEWVVFWYNLSGSFYFIEIFTWPPAVLIAAFIMFYFNKFFGLLILNWVGFNHMLGWLTWTPYSSPVYSLKAIVENYIGDGLLYHPISLIGIVFALILTTIQILSFKYND